MNTYLLAGLREAKRYWSWWIGFVAAGVAYVVLTGYGFPGAVEMLVALLATPALLTVVVAFVANRFLEPLSARQWMIWYGLLFALLLLNDLRGLLTRP